MLKYWNNKQGNIKKGRMTACQEAAELKRGCSWINACHPRRKGILPRIKGSGAFLFLDVLLWLQNAVSLHLLISFSPCVVLTYFLHSSREFLSQVTNEPKQCKSRAKRDCFLTERFTNGNATNRKERKSKLTLTSP